MTEQRIRASQGKVQYSDDGLTCNSYHRESPETIKKALNPIDTLVDGTPNVQPKRRRSWWEAQCRLYGIRSEEKTVAAFKENLASRLQNFGTLHITEDMKTTEFQLKRSYEHCVEYERQKEESAENAGILEQPLRPVTTYKSRDVIKMFDSKEDGTDMSAEAREAEREAARRERYLRLPEEYRKKIEAEEAAGKKKAKDALEAQIENMTTLHSYLLEHGRQGIDIEGRWQMNCPEITLDWCHNDDHEHQEMFWNIHRPQPDEECRWVVFEQIIVDGILRIEMGTPTVLGRKYPFTWRGRETGESGLEFDDEVNSGYIVFSSSHECSGMFGCSIGGPWAFTGMKIDKAVPSKRQKTLKKEYENYERRFYKEGFFI
jgi:hypothetical protein